MHSVAVEEISEMKYEVRNNKLILEAFCLSCFDGLLDRTWHNLKQ